MYSISTVLIVFSLHCYDKKHAVIGRLSEWVSNLIGSNERAVYFVEDNQSKIESIIDEYISFSNKMHGKSSLSEAEIIIAEKLLTESK